jgi:predicted negative regulator of RcsB-dependent stress response
MKLGRLFLSAIVGTATLLTFNVFAQEETEQEKECKRMRFLAGEELKIQNYAVATTYYLKGETICGGYDKANYDRMIGTLRNTIGSEADKVRKATYMDTLLAVYTRMEEKGLYDKSNDLIRATYIVQATKPNRVLANELFTRGINSFGIKASETNISLFYYNLYVLHTEAAADKKAEYKKQLISEYFHLSALIGEAKMSVKTQENLTTYFNNVVRTCADILPELKGFMSSLPKEVNLKKSTVNNFISLLENKGCSDSKEYEMLIDTLISIDPSIDAVLAKAKLLRAKKRYSESIATLKNAKTMTTDAEKKEEIEFMIAEIQFSSGSYNAAYTTALSVSGKNRSDAVRLAASCVAKTANSCGTSTLERKANYLYAAQLADRAGDGSAASKYRAAGPSDGDWFDAGITSVTLSCWGITVSK